ncbi:MAG: glycerol-3-phosphate acyltransferase [Chloroflexi bacterium]|nr:glycerol-3-phosphate acyltransferase [Chloroflexota bacterium]
MGYLLGSIPVAYLVARSRGIGILEAGTRNPGAANVFRTVSRPLGVFVLVADVLKGIAAVAAADVLGTPAPIVAVAGAACLVGHWYPLFLKFRGGTGMASAGGVVIGLSPMAGIIAGAVTLAALALMRNTGRAGGAGYLGFLIVSFPTTAWAAIAGATLMASMVGLRAAYLQMLERRRGAG